MRWAYERHKVNSSHGQLVIGKVAVTNHQIGVDFCDELTESPYDHTDTYTADGVSGSDGRLPTGSGGGGICWERLAGLS